MPCQVSWQSVAIKSQVPVHGLGAEAAAAGGAFVGMMSAAHPSTAHEAPATARTIPVEIPSFVMSKPQRLNHCERLFGMITLIWYQLRDKLRSAPYASMGTKSHSCGRCATLISTS